MTHRSFNASLVVYPMAHRHGHKVIHSFIALMQICQHSSAYVSLLYRRKKHRYLGPSSEVAVVSQFDD